MGDGNYYPGQYVGKVPYPILQADFFLICFVAGFKFGTSRFRFIYLTNYASSTLKYISYQGL